MFSIPRPHRLAAGVLAFAALAQAADYSSWSHYRDVTVNTSGLNLSAPVTKVPLLVRFNATSHADMFTGASSMLAGGADIRVTKADGTTDVPFEIEQATTGANGSLVLWVLADAVENNSATAASFRVFWGKAGATSESSSAEVFNPSNGFVGVWHMNSTGDETDATGNGNHAVAQNAPASAQGHIGLGRSLARANTQHFVVADAPTLNFTAPALTMSAWVNAEDWDGSTRIFQKGAGGQAAQFGLRETSLDRFSIEVNGGNVNDAATAAPATGTWALLHAMVDETSLRLYNNGVEVLNSVYAGDPIATTSIPLHLGRQPEAANYFNGTFDEMRIQNVARSADWALLEYETQKAGNTVTTIGATQSPGSSTTNPYATWGSHKDITLNTSASGANVAGDVYNFPVLVRLGADESAILSAAKSNGADIRFARGNTALPYEIESWSSTAAAIWVKVDTIKGNNSTQKITMYWGKNDANSESSGKAVFDTANGFVAVWHMNEDGTTAEPSATGVDTLRASVVGTVPSAAGVAGNARSFSTTANYLRVLGSGNAESALNFAQNTNYTLSAWVYADSINPASNNGHGIVNKGNDQYGLGIYSGDQPKFYDIMTRGTTGNGNSSGWNQAQTNGSNGTDSVTAQTGVGAWRLITGTWQGAGTPQDTAYIYVNGKRINHLYIDDIGTNGRNTNVDVFIGVLGGNNPSRAFLGSIDEVSISNVVRDSNWVKLSYENQKAANTLTNIGLTPPAPSGPYAGWTKDKEITLNTTASGANVAAEVRDFPVLIRLGSAESAILSEAKAGGADIRFARGNTTLPYEIESWSATSAAIWVKVDTIKGNNNTQQITMYWGKSDANSESNSAAVFDTTKGFVAVWHMNGAAAAEVNAAGDADLNAAATGTLASVDGLIGKARSYTGTTENYLSVPNSASGKLNFPASADYTLSAWVFSEETALDNRGILNKGNDQWLIGVYGGSEDKFYDLMTRGGGSWNQASTEPALLTTATGVGVWRHVVGVWKGSGTPQDTGRIYINGVLANTTFFDDLGFDGRDTTSQVYIGVLWENGGLARPYHGRIDEVVISNVYRDSNWVKLAFESQKLTQKLTNIGVTAEVPATAPTAPQTLTAAVSGTQQGTVTLTWTAPTNNGGATITGYTVTGAPSGTCTTTGALTCTISGLTAGNYTFTVVATNSVGNSPVSNIASATITSLLPGAFAIHMDGSHKPYTFRLPTAAIATTEKLSMTITNIQGKQVWTGSINPAASKVGELTWNGKTLKGQPVAPGMYIVRLRAEMPGQTIEAVRGSIKK